MLLAFAPMNLYDGASMLCGKAPQRSSHSMADMVTTNYDSQADVKISEKS